MEELDDINDPVRSFDTESADVEALLARIDRLQGLIARREPTYAAAVEAYNAALRAAYDQFHLIAPEYHRAAETASEISSLLTFVMRVRDEANEKTPGWDESTEGRQLQRWIEIWEEFENVVDEDRGTSLPRVKLFKKPLSELIAELPRKPEDVKLPGFGRAIDPKVMASVESSWKRIDAWLAANSPALAQKMNPGATLLAISRAESSLGVELPEAVRASYLVHDGSTVIGLFPPGYYSTLDDMTRNCLMMREGLEEGGFEDFEDQFVGVGPFKRAYYHPGWIPMTENSGCFTFIDLAPEEGGVVGQLINFLRDDGPQDIAAPGLAEYLAYLADGLEAGAATIEDDSYLNWNIGPYTPGAVKAPPESPPPSTNAAVAEPGKRYFEFKEGSSSKFWEITQQGSEMTTRYGKIGTKGQSTTKTLASPEKAASEAAKLIAKKVKEGYVEVQATTKAGSATPEPGGSPSNDWSASADPEPMLGKVLPSASDRKRRLFAVACCRRVEDWLVVTSGLVFDMRIEHYQRAVEAADRFADGEATPEEMRDAFWAADDSAFCNLEVEDATADEMRKASYGDDAGWTARVREMSAEDRRELEALPDPATWYEDEDHTGDLPAGVDPFRDVADGDAALVGETIGRQVLLLVRVHGGRKREAEERKAQAAMLRDIFGDPYPPPAFDPAWRTPEVVTLAEGIYADKAFDRMPALADALEKAGCTDQIILGHCRGAGPHVRGCWVVDAVLGKS